MVFGLVVDVGKTPRAASRQKFYYLPLQGLEKPSTLNLLGGSYILIDTQSY